MKGVGDDTIAGEIGALQIGKVFCITRGRKEVNGRKFLGYNVERLRFIQLFVRIYCLRFVQAGIFFSVLCLHNEKF